jgi:hypothetical protein
MNESISCVEGWKTDEEDGRCDVVRLLVNRIRAYVHDTSSHILPSTGQSCSLKVIDKS